jgi:hypothetical protein
LTIPNGASAVVAWNGSDFVEIGAGSIGNLVVNGTLTVTGATTLQSTLAVTGNITNTAGTANGVAYLNGSKVVTSGSALTFNGTTQFTYTSSSDASFDIVASGAGTAGYLGLTNAGSDTQAIGFMLVEKIHCRHRTLHPLFYMLITLDSLQKYFCRTSLQRIELTYGE